MSINSRFITFGLDDTISRSEQNTAAFVNTVNDAYVNPYRTGSGNQPVYADLNPHPFIGRYDRSGAYEPLLNPQNLSSKLNTRNPINELSRQSIITDSF